MGRPLRHFPFDQPFHLGGSAVADLQLFVDDVERQDFVHRLARAIETARWDVFLVCLMTTHHHVVFRPIADGSSAAMRDLQGGFARAFNARHKRRGAVWQGRFWTREIVGDDALREAIRYVALNPVRAGIVARPEDWPWSTYGQTLGLSEPWPGIDPTLGVEPFGDVATLRSFVEAPVSDTTAAVSDTSWPVLALGGPR